MIGCALTALAFSAIAQDQIQLSYTSESTDGYGDAGGIITPWVTFPAEITDIYTGATVKSVTIQTGSKATNVQLYVKNLRDDKTNLVSQKVGTLEAGENEIVLETPLTIEAGAPLSFGYKATFSRARGGLYGKPDNPDAHHVYYNTKSKWFEVNGAFCISVTLEGTLPQNEAALLGCTDAVVPVGEMYGEMTLTIRNYGVNEISTISYAYAIDSAQSVTESYTFENPIPKGATGEATISIPSPGVGQHEVCLELLSVNGETELRGNTNVMLASITERDLFFVRRIVCEEATGTWCGWCPRGMVGMEMMEEKYPGEFISVGVHCGAEDPFVVADFEPVRQKVNSYPGCVVDRYLTGDPYEDIEGLVEREREVDHNVGLRITPEYKDGYVTVRSLFRVNAPRSADGLNFAFLVLEDEVAGYQKNSYSGWATPMGGWENLPSVVDPFYFKDVARAALPSYSGQSFLEGNLVPGEDYEFEYSFAMPQNVLRANNVKLVGLVLDNSNGFILNADRVKLIDDSNAVNEIETAAATVLHTDVYTIDGLLLDSFDGPLPATANYSGRLLILRETTSDGVTARKFIL